MENSINNKRIDFLDFAKGIAMFLVVLGHTEGGMPNKPMIYFIHGFFMPLFYVVFGYLMAEKRELDLPFINYFKKRFTGLIIPCLYMYFILYVIYYIIYRPHGIKESFYPIYALCQRNIIWNAPLWFLFVLFTGSLVFYIEMSISRTNKFVHIFFFIINLLLTVLMSRNNLFCPPNGIGGAFIASVYIQLGYYLHKYKFLKNNIFLETKWKKYSLFLICSFVYSFLAIKNANVNYSINRYGDYGIIVALITGVLGSILFLMICYKFEKAIIADFFIIVGRNTLIIIGFHEVVKVAIMYILNSKITIEYNFLFAVILTLINLMICTFGSILLKRIYKKWRKNEKQKNRITESNISCNDKYKN